MVDTAKNYSDMTDEEYWALDDEVTRNPPDVSGITGGFFTERTRQREGAECTIILDQFSADYLKAAAEATHKTPAQIVGELVRKELKSAV
ncbi:hypothetical protein AGMMS4952_24610 [Spirochaetia bacterium]|nr:hypothetical protein AGMMS4952_24610 [Spirochaetia bacterium]